jgi:hypothetical protein
MLSLLLTASLAAGPSYALISATTPLRTSPDASAPPIVVSVTPAAAITWLAVRFDQRHGDWARVETVPPDELRSQCYASLGGSNAVVGFWVPASALSLTLTRPVSWRDRSGASLTLHPGVAVQPTGGRPKHTVWLADGTFDPATALQARLTLPPNALSFTSQPVARPDAVDGEYGTLPAGFRAASADGAWQIEALASLPVAITSGGAAYAWSGQCASWTGPVPPGTDTTDTSSISLSGRGSGVVETVPAGTALVWPDGTAAGEVRGDGWSAAEVSEQGDKRCAAITLRARGAGLDEVKVPVCWSAAARAESPPSP